MTIPEIPGTPLSRSRLMEAWDFMIAEFLVRQLAGLVEDLVGDLHLADVVEQPAQPGLFHRGGVHAQGVGEGHQQGADAHGMLKGIGIGGLDPGQADEGPGVPQHRGVHGLHQGPGLGRVQLLPQAHIVEQAIHHARGLAQDAPGRDGLLLLGDPGRGQGRRPVAADSFSCWCQPLLDLRLGRGSGHVLAAVGVDVDLVQALVLHLLDLPGC